MIRVVKAQQQFTPVPYTILGWNVKKSRKSWQEQGVHC